MEKLGDLIKQMGGRTGQSSPALETPQRAFASKPEKPKVFTCEVCHDMGWVLWADDKVPAPCPGCSSYNPEENLKKYAGVPERRWRDTFETFSPKRAPAMAEALKAATEFASRSSVPWLVLAGHIGCGKTHLCYAVANRMTA